MLSMLEQLYNQLMEVKVGQQQGSEKSDRVDGHSSYLGGSRSRFVDWIRRCEKCIHGAKGTSK